MKIKKFHNIEKTEMAIFIIKKLFNKKANENNQHVKELMKFNKIDLYFYYYKVANI